MNDCALHLVERVLPEVPIRQWVCSLPWQLRTLLGYDRVLCAAVLGAFVDELQASYHRRAKRTLGLRSVSLAHTGAVSFVQRFDSALRLNVHAHTLALDGVYLRHEGTELRFHALPAPSVEDIAQLAHRVVNRIERLLRKSGRVVDDQLQDQALQDEQTVLLSCYHAAAQGIELAGAQAGRRSLRLVNLPAQQQRSVRPQGLVAEVRGVNIHAETVVDGRDRKRLQRLCRYVARPPLAQDRLESLPEGRVRYCMKKPWSDGTVALLFDPLSFIARLCALTPPPRFHMLRYAGVLAAHSTLRSKVVPVAGTAPESFRSPFEQMLLFSDAPLLHKGCSLEPAAPKQTPRSGDRSGSQSRHLFALGPGQSG